MDYLTEQQRLHNMMRDNHRIIVNGIRVLMRLATHLKCQLTIMSDYKEIVNCIAAPPPTSYKAVTKNSTEDFVWCYGLKHAALYETWYYSNETVERLNDEKRSSKDLFMTLFRVNAWVKEENPNDACLSFKCDTHRGAKGWTIDIPRDVFAICCNINYESLSFVSDVCNFSRALLPVSTWLQTTKELILEAIEDHQKSDRMQEWIRSCEPTNVVASRLSEDNSQQWTVTKAYFDGTHVVCTIENCSEFELQEKYERFNLHWSYTSKKSTAYYDGVNAGGYSKSEIITYAAKRTGKSMYHIPTDNMWIENFNKEITEKESHIGSSSPNDPLAHNSYLQNKRDWRSKKRK